MIALTVNGKKYQADVDPNTPLLWVLRDNFKLLGTKYGCGKGECGHCTVHVDGEAIRSCVTSVGDVTGKPITTIEGIPESHPLKKAWISHEVCQCGYCQPGQIMQAAAVMAKDPKATADAIYEKMEGILCRCGTYPRIKRAIRESVAKGGKQ